MIMVVGSGVVEERDVRLGGDGMERSGNCRVGLDFRGLFYLLGLLSESAHRA